ncbi:MAG: hypothetical protein AAGI23_18660 [Bacteroidota bacterium]
MTRLLFYSLLACFFVACQSDDNVFWGNIESRTDDKKKRRRLVLKETNSSFQGDDCVTCLTTSDTLILRLGNFYRDENQLTCTFEDILPTQLQLIDYQQQSCPFELSNSDVEVVIGRFETQSPPFDLSYRQSVFLRIPFSCVDLSFVGEKGQVILSYAYRDCEGIYEVSTDTLSYDLGCPDLIEDEILFIRAAQPLQNNLNVIPSYSLATYELQATADVLISDGATVRWRVCDQDEGFIRVGSDKNGIVKVGKGAFFKAGGVKD